MRDLSSATRDVKLSRRGLLRAVAVAGAGLAVAACSSQPAQPAATTQPATAAPAAKGTVTVVFWGHNSPQTVEAYNANIPLFQKKYPNIKIEYQQKPGGDYAQLILTAIAAGNAPDVFRVGDWQILEYMRDKAVRPLVPDAFQAKDGNEILANWFNQSFPKKFLVDNNLYAVPEDVSYLLLLANMDVLNEAGIDKFPDTPEKVIDAAKKGTKSESGRWVRSGFEWYYNHELWETEQFTHLIRTFDGSIYDQDAKMAIDKGDAALKALTYYYDTVFTWKVSNPAFALTFGQPTPSHFETANSVLHPAGAWKIPSIKSAGKIKKWDSGLWRTGPQEHTLAWAWSLGLSGTSKVPLEATQWIAFLQSPEAVDNRTKLGGTMAPVKDFDKTEYAKTPELQNWVRLGLTSRFQDPYPSYPKVSKAISKMMQAVAQNGVKPADALDQAVKELKQI